MGIQMGKLTTSTFLPLNMSKPSVLHVHGQYTFALNIQHTTSQGLTTSILHMVCSLDRVPFTLLPALNTARFTYTSLSVSGPPHLGVAASSCPRLTPAP